MLRLVWLWLVVVVGGRYWWVVRGVTCSSLFVSLQRITLLYCTFLARFEWLLYKRKNTRL